MQKEYKFDDSCEFDGCTKEDIIRDFKRYEKEKKSLNIGPYSCNIHPSLNRMCISTLNMPLTKLIKEVLSEFTKSSNVELGLKGLFTFYKETFTEDRIESIIEYAVENIINDKLHVDEGDIPEAKSYREILTREEDVEALMELSKKYKKVHF